MGIQPVLVTGATGYVGGRLVPKLLMEGYRVRAMVRSPEKLSSRSWVSHPMVEVVEGDVLDLKSLNKACKGCRAAFYLVHSMNPYTKDFAMADRDAARNMADAASEAALERIIYLGGLIPKDQPLSHHLNSRLEVGEILSSNKVPVTKLRAAMILGSGSASFEILRYLVERLPVMITPKWVHSLVQPISIRNVLEYLVDCLENDEVIGQTFDIGGPDVITYEELFRIYAKEAGLPRRRILPVPVLSPKLSSYWIHLITPLHSSIARPLAEGLRNSVVCEDERIKSIIPLNLMSCSQTIGRILEKQEQQIIETCWTDAGPTVPPEWVHSGDQGYSGGAVFNFGYRIRLYSNPEKVWKYLERIGGKNGWYFADFLWQFRGVLDKLAGGVGSRIGRRHSRDIVVGDVIDFWRVLEVREGRRLLLMSELKAPGDAILDFNIKHVSDKKIDVELESRFLPKGLWGLFYWYFLLPFHSWIFKGMLRALAEKINPGRRPVPVRFIPDNRRACKSDS